jgi:RNA polymerase sporulation-specific sigma factor
MRPANSIVPTAPLRTAEIFVLIRAGDESARDEFARRNLRLVSWLASRFRRRHPGVGTWSDLIGAGSLGLTRAIAKFDPGYGVSFSSFAGRVIWREMAGLRPAPSAPGFVRESDGDLDLEAVPGPCPEPWEAVAAADERDCRARWLGRLLGRLQPRYRGVLEIRYGLGGHEPLSLREAARVFRLTAERVRQIEARAVWKLQHMAAVDALRGPASETEGLP